MTKYLIYFFLFSLTFAGLFNKKSDDSKIEELSYELTEIFEIEKTKDEIYNLTLEFLDLKLIDNRSSIIKKNQEDGSILLKHRTQSQSGVVLGMNIEIDIYYTLKINIKDKKIRLIYDNFTYTDERHSRPLNSAKTRTERKSFKIHLKQSKDNCSKFSKELIEYINQEKKSDDDW